MLVTCLILALMRLNELGIIVFHVERVEIEVLKLYIGKTARLRL
jgi:hypothetical protein